MAKITPNIFISNLAAICSQHLLAEKWLVAPSLRVGHQWVEQVARSGQPAVNLRVTTLTGLALKLAAGSMPKGARMVSSLGSQVIIDGLLTEAVIGTGEGYLTSIISGGRKSPGLVKLIAGAIEDLRMAGSDPGDLKKSWMEVPVKKKELTGIFVGYMAALEKNNLVDRANTFTLAMDALISGSAVPEGLILLPDTATEHALEQRLVRALPESHLVKISTDTPGKGDAGRNISLLSHIKRPLSAPQAKDPASDDSAAIIPCVGEINEVRTALRSALKSDTPLDHLEILVTDNTTYLPMIYEETLRLFTDIENPSGDAPVTFADGIPTRYSRPGRALAGWIQWVREDYAQVHAVRLLQDGLIAPPIAPSDESGIGLRELSRLLASLPIGFGRDRYLEVIAKEEQALMRRRERLLAEAEGGPGREPDLRKTEHRIEALGQLKSIIKKLLEATPASASSTDASWLSAALNLLTELIQDVNRLDNFAREAFEKEIKEFIRWSRLGVTLHNLDLLSWLSSLPQTLRVGGSGPAEGCIHVSSVTSGGHSGRLLTLILGLDDSRCPGSRTQDPVLLDREREQFDPPLPVSAHRLAQKVDDFAALLARIRGRVVMTYSCRSLADDREKFPSPVLLSAYRILYGNREADLEEMTRGLGPPASFAPGDIKSCLTADDWWMLRCCREEKLDDAVGHLFNLHDHLRLGTEAAAKRQQSGFSEVTGRVPEAGPDVDPTSPGAAPLSPSRAEKMGECPLKYFFAEILDIQPPDEILQKDREWWLDPMQFGSLLHEVLAAFTKGLIKTGERPGYETHLPAMEKIVEERLEAWRLEHPPPSESLYHVQERRLQKAARSFLRTEEEESSSLTAAAVELPIGLGGRVKEPGHPDPVEVRLPGGRSITTRGRIDRVDLQEIGTYLLTDHKSGSSKKFDHGGDDPTIGGRRLQPVLYREMAHAWGRESAETKGEPGSFRYTFPASFNNDEPVYYSPGQLDESLTVLGHVVSLMTSGAFPPTDDHKSDCKYCPYKGSLCPDVAGQAQMVAEDLATGTDALLEPFRGMRGYTGGDSEGYKDSE